MVRFWTFVTIGSILFLVSADPTAAGPTKERKQALCHQIIDPKKLTGAVLKTEWDRCMANPDS